MGVIDNYYKNKFYTKVNNGGMRIGFILIKYKDKIDIHSDDVLNFLLSNCNTEEDLANYVYCGITEEEIMSNTNSRNLLMKCFSNHISSDFRYRLDNWFFDVVSSSTITGSLLSIFKKMLLDGDLNDLVTSKIDIQKFTHELLCNSYGDFNRINFDFLKKLGFNPFDGDYIKYYLNLKDKLDKDCFDEIMSMVSSKNIRKLKQYESLVKIYKPNYLARNTISFVEVGNYYNNMSMEARNFWKDSKNLYFVLDFLKKSKYMDKNPNTFGIPLDKYVSTKECYEFPAMFNVDGTARDDFFKDGVNSLIETFINDKSDYSVLLNNKCVLKDIYCSNLNKLDGYLKGLFTSWRDFSAVCSFVGSAFDMNFVNFICDDKGIRKDYFNEVGATDKFYEDAIYNFYLLEGIKKMDNDYMRHYFKEQVQYLNFINNYPYFNSLIFEFICKDNLSLYFDEIGVKKDFIKKLYDTNQYKSVFLEHSELDCYMPKEVLYYFKLCRDRELKETFYRLDFDSILLFFDENGIKDEGVNALFNFGEFDFLCKLTFGLLENSLSDKQFTIIECYKKIGSNSIKNKYKNYVNLHFDSLSIDKIIYIGDLLYRISVSNSSDIQHFGDSLIDQLLLFDNPLEKFEKVEDVFIRNNLPIVGKSYSTFKKLYIDSYKGNGSVLDSLIGDFTSPVLKQSSLFKRELIIFSDLIKVSFESNNRSVRAYIDNIENGSIIVKKIRNGEVNLNELDNNNMIILKEFLAHLNTLYNNTVKGKNNPHSLTSNMEEDFVSVISLFESSKKFKDYPLCDRVIRMFGYFAGLTSLEEAKRYLNESRDNADKKNRESIKLNDFTLSDGDFIKGIVDLKYLSNILQNGSVAREFLGSSAASDTTPLDTDLSRISGSYDNLDSAINSTISKDYGKTFLVLKNDNRDRFAFTRECFNGDEVSLSMKDIFSKMEVFATGDDNHYGIRTGFPSSEIDYIVTSEDSSRIGYEIVKNGFYIPVIDRYSGKVVFTPEDYDLLKSKMSGLKYYGSDKYIFADMIDTSELDTIKESLDKNWIETNKKNKLIIDKISKALKNVGLDTKTFIDGDLTEGVVEVLSTGSTARGTNLPDDFDFDFVFRLDCKDFNSSDRMREIRKSLASVFKLDGNEVITVDGDFRLTGVRIDGIDEPVKIDISFIQKTDKITYSTEACLHDRLETIYNQDTSEDKSLYNSVIANIQFAKSFLISHNVYKKCDKDPNQGGLGGVGVENWILQNGGSFEFAARSFLKFSRGRDFESFKKVYKVWDFGQNHFASKNDIYTYDEFIYANMNEIGYKKMVRTLTEYINYVNNLKSSKSL